MACRPAAPFAESENACPMDLTRSRNAGSVRCPVLEDKRFPWLQELLADVDEDEATPVAPAAVGEAETITRQAVEIASLKKTVALLQAENHQLAQANIALEERSQGADLARQAAINAGRRRNADLPTNVSSLR